MDWREEYKRRLASAEDAMKLVKAGDLVMIPIAGPRVLPGALFRHCTENGVAIDLRVAAPLTDPGWYRAGHEETFRLEFELFIGDFARPAMDEGRATYLPNLFSLNFKDIDEKRPEGRTVDVFLVSVTPPDEHGYVSFGAHNWNKRSHTRRARTVVAEVDAGLRPVCGDNIVHVSEIDAFVEIPPVQITRGLVEAWLRRVEDDSAREAYMGIVDELGEDLDRLIVVGPVMTRLPAAQVRRVLGLAQPPEDARTIAGHVRELVPDGATIQIGAGEPSMYLARAGAFEGKRDLGLHTEMAAPGIARLVECGVINGARKTLHPNLAIASAWSGSDIEDLKIVTNNPKFEVRDPECVLDVRTIAQNDNFYAMNNALSVDLTGQINAESVFGSRMINGTGGQPEFQIGAALSRGGRGITLLPSTALDGAVSRVVAQHEAGSMITVPRYFADTVVTEYGIARLWGKNHRQRAQELIVVAHPDFRAELKQAAKRL
ncbi:MAG: acetyl-CoA hydrolase/transferase family protein [Chloroflexi bacterium]|nr:MAG: acetyl-CoA hydrolase/transferase family protein [Chloroflexota bacterium]TMG01534.1 MAG: acetyl-CoA hydrolase/transferase family protein [Chloroflexota bacterium]